MHVIIYHIIILYTIEVKVVTFPSAYSILSVRSKKFSAPAVVRIICVKLFKFTMYIYMTCEKLSLMCTRSHKGVG